MVLIFSLLIYSSRNEDLDMKPSDVEKKQKTQNSAKDLENHDIFV